MKENELGGHVARMGEERKVNKFWWKARGLTTRETEA
jgi:hypothetical protein